MSCNSSKTKNRPILLSLSLEQTYYVGVTVTFLDGTRVQRVFPSLGEAEIYKESAFNRCFSKEPFCTNLDNQ